MKPNCLESRNREDVVSIDGYAHRVNPVIALRALYELLEDYGPMWYTQEAHDLAQAALGE